MTRLTYLLIALFAMTVFACKQTPEQGAHAGGQSAAASRSAAQGDARPNIIFAFADDWGRYASAYREPGRPTINDAIYTPNFDTLATGGVLFWDAHVSAPSCSAGALTLP